MEQNMFEFNLTIQKINPGKPPMDGSTETLKTSEKILSDQEKMVSEEGIVALFQNKESATMVEVEEIIKNHQLEPANLLTILNWAVKNIEWIQRQPDGFMMRVIGERNSILNKDRLVNLAFEMKYQIDRKGNTNQVVQEINNFFKEQPFHRRSEHEILAIVKKAEQLPEDIKLLRTLKYQELFSRPFIQYMPNKLWVGINSGEETEWFAGWKPANKN